MKRIQSACICQTLHFILKDDIDHAVAAKQVSEEVEHYKNALEKTRTQYRIVEETVQSDDSVIIKVIKQYNASPVGDYLN